jgi:hypothetical protein
VRLLSGNTEPTAPSAIVTSRQVIARQRVARSAWCETFNCLLSLLAPCHKSCPLSAFEIVEKLDTFCGREQRITN